MKRLSWLVGPPAAGKTTWALGLQALFPAPRVLELAQMLHPLVDPMKQRQGMMQAKSLVMQAIRRVELDPANDGLPPLVVIMAMVDEKTLFPLSQDEEVLLMLPPKDVWERRFLGRLPFHMPGSRPMQLDDALRWYEEHARWQALGLPVTLLTGESPPG